MAATDKSYYVGQANVSLAPRASAGAINGGFKYTGDLQSLQINFKQTFADVQENNTGYGFQALHAPTGITADLKLVLSEWSSANIQKNLWGTAPAQSAGGTVTGETITAYNDTDFYLGASLSGGMALGVTALTLTAGATPLVLNTDYTLDGSYGRVSILPGSTVVTAGAGVAVTAAYTYATTNGNIGAFTAGPVEYALRVDAKNVANPFIDSSNSAFAAVGIQVYRVMFDVAKALDLVGKKDAPLELDGVILVDPTVQFIPGNPRSVLMNIMKA